jgi:predicted DCC family thiol-disulfide oxidoreductase YuxK
MTTATSPDAPPYLVLYDGVCGLCQRSVQFILKRDPRGRFHFMPLQSRDAVALLERHGRLSPGEAVDYDSFILVQAPGTDRERVFSKWQAARRVARGLGGLMGVGAALAFWVPTAVGDWLYDQVATRRYRWFGKADACLLPSPAERERFVGLSAVVGPTQEADAA